MIFCAHYNYKVFFHLDISCAFDFLRQALICFFEPFEQIDDDDLEGHASIICTTDLKYAIVLCATLTIIDRHFTIKVLLCLYLPDLLIVTLRVIEELKLLLSSLLRA